MRPNIIFFFSDQQRWDTVGAYGGSMGVTPHVDRMASEGVLFRNAFTCQPVCGPTRACLQTGRYAAEVDVHTNHRRLPRRFKPLAERLRAAGYEAGYLGKWHLASCGELGGKDDFRDRAVPPERRGGYDDFWLASDVLEFTSHSYDGHMFDAAGERRDFPKGRYRVDAQTDWALEYLRSRDGRRPFFLFLSYIEPHHQNDHRHFEGPKGSRRRFGTVEPAGDLVGQEGDWQAELPDYLGCCHALDGALGRVRSGLKRLGLGENTLLVYTSDHGCHFRTRNGEYKRACHDACLRVPMVACGPGFRGGRVVDELVSLIDMPPTILAAAGLPTPRVMRGRPVQGLVDGTARRWPGEIFAQISESHCGRCIRTHRWKYSVRAPNKTGADASSGFYVEDFLYDLEADPHERSNLVRDGDYAAVRKELRGVLRRRMAGAGEKVPRIVGAR